MSIFQPRCLLVVITVLSLRHTTQYLFTLHVHNCSHYRHEQTCEVLMGFGAEREKNNNFEIIFFSFSSHKKSGCYGDTQKM